MSRHDQRPKPRDMTCPACKKGECSNCVDILRAIYSEEMICTCTRANHAGEANVEQVLDPFTGSVHGPGATVTADGELEIDPNFKEKFREQLGE
jgi:hypothetical protein